LRQRPQQQKKNCFEKIDGPVQKIPDWVKSTMGWYAEGLISDDEIISAIQYLINEGIIKLK